MEFLAGFAVGTGVGFIAGGALLSSSDKGESDYDMVQLELLRMAIDRDDPKPELLLRVTDMMAEKKPVSSNSEGK